MCYSNQDEVYRILYYSNIFLWSRKIRVSNLTPLENELLEHDIYLNVMNTNQSFIKERTFKNHRNKNLIIIHITSAFLFVKASFFEI